MASPLRSVYRRLRSGLCCVALLAAGSAAAAANVCDAASLAPDCLAARAFAAIDSLPADERSGVVGTLLAVHLGQHHPAPPALLAEARRIARSARPDERLQVLLPLTEIAVRAGDRAAAKQAQRQAEAVIGRLAARPGRVEAYLQIADSCVGLAELAGGPPVLAPQWAGTYRRYCKPAFFARMQGKDAFRSLVREHLQLVGHFLVQDDTAFRIALPGVVSRLRSVGLLLEASELSPTERETALLIATALQMSAGTLACLMQQEEACGVVLAGLEIPDLIDQPELWSSWAAVAATRGEGLAAAGRTQGAGGALEWLLARADEARYQSHRAAFLASAAWLSGRIEALRRPRRETHSA